MVNKISFMDWWQGMAIQASFLGVGSTKAKGADARHSTSPSALHDGWVCREEGREVVEVQVWVDDVQVEVGWNLPALDAGAIMVLHCCCFPR